MDASPDTLAQTVRAKRTAIDNDIELLRVRLAQADPRRRIDVNRIARHALPIVAGAAALWLRARRRHRVDSLDALLVHGLNDVYQAEHQLLPALDRMRMRASNDELVRALKHHHAQTEGHIERLERAFRSVRSRPQSGSSAAVAAIVADGDRLVTGTKDPRMRDASIIATARRLEHLEIAIYGTVRTYAESLGFTYVAQLLQQTLEEERATDEKLTRLAERFVIDPSSKRTSRVR